MQLGVSQAVIGVNVDTDAIYFGRTRPGSMSKRNINITNNYDFPMIVTIQINGNLSEYVSVSNNIFLMAPGENKEVTYYAMPDKNAPEGDYFGETRVIFKRSMFWE